MSRQYIAHTHTHTPHTAHPCSPLPTPSLPYSPTLHSTFPSWITPYSFTAHCPLPTPPLPHSSFYTLHSPYAIWITPYSLTLHSPTPHSPLPHSPTLHSTLSILHLHLIWVQSCKPSSALLHFAMVACADLDSSALFHHSQLLRKQLMYNTLLTSCLKKSAKPSSAPPGGCGHNS